MGGHQLAQLNLALPLEPLDSPLLAEFVAALEPVNSAADAAPGFIWRLQTDEGDATGIRLEDERLIVNLSVWDSVEALRGFVAGRAHLDVLSRRREWFAALGEAQLVLWWVPAGRRPGLDEAQQRLAELRRDGPSPRAFTLRQSYPPPAGGPASDTANSSSGSLNQPRSSSPAAS